jgi:hypothetical protein
MAPLLLASSVIRKADRQGSGSLQALRPPPEPYSYNGVRSQTQPFPETLVEKVVFET